MERVTSTPELVELICRFLSKKEQANAACVNKQWSDIALSFLWSTLNNFRPLLEILSPLIPDSLETEFGFKFLRYPVSSDWARFDEYCRRIRIIKIYHIGARTAYEKLFDQIARSRRKFEILPNLRCIQWGNSSLLTLATYSPMFMHDKVEALSLSFGDLVPSTDLVRSYCDEIIDRIPNLARLSLRTHTGHPAVRMLTAGLHNIRVLHLRHGYRLTAEDVKHFARLPQLDELVQVDPPDAHSYDFPDDNQAEFDERDDVGLFLHPTDCLPASSFPVLRELNLQVSLNEMSDLIIAASLSSLVSLNVTSRLLENPTTVARLCAAAGQCCPLLELMTCLPAIPNYFGRIQDYPTSSLMLVDFNCLRPLMSCKNMKELVISHQHPLLIRPEDIETIASSWPKLESIYLNEEPCSTWPADGTTPPVLTLNDLLPFARHCPGIAEIGLLMDIKNADLHFSPSSPIFHKDISLSVGFSTVEDKGRVAWYLGLLFSDCEVEIIMPSSLAGEEMVPRQVLSQGNWDSVQVMIPALRTARNERWDLEVENAKLKAEV